MQPNVRISWDTTYEACKDQMIQDDTVKSTPVSYVTLGSHAGHVYRPAISADQHLKGEQETKLKSRSRFGSRVLGGYWQAPVSSKHSFACAPFKKYRAATWKTAILFRNAKALQNASETSLWTPNLFPAIGLVAFPAETCNQHKHFGLMNL